MNITVFWRLSTNIKLISCSWHLLGIGDLFSMFMPVKAWIQKEFSKWCFCCNTDVNIQWVKLRNRLEIVTNFLCCSSSHSYIINKVSAKLGDKLVPIVGMIGLVDSTQEIRQKCVYCEDINGQFVGLALSCCMGDTHIRFNCCFLHRLISCWCWECSLNKWSLVTSRDCSLSF